MGNLPRDQKRLQRALNDKNLKLRFNIIKGYCQVWYFPRNSAAYIVMEVPDHYSISQIIHELKGRQLKRKQLWNEYLRREQQRERDYERNIHDLAEETAQVACDNRFNKVTTSAWTKKIGA